MDQRQRSDEKPLDLIQTDPIVGAVMSLGRARRLVVRILLRVIDCTTRAGFYNEHPFDSGALAAL